VELDTGSPEAATTEGGHEPAVVFGAIKRLLTGRLWQGAGAASLIAAAILAAMLGSRPWRQQPDSAAKAPPASIAVLPFLDLSEHHDQGYFSDGLAEELIDMLAQVRELRVPSHTSSFSFAGKSDDIEVIARKLRVTHVLEGSVRRVNDRIRVTAQLIRADDGYHLWSSTYDRDLKDIFEV
jgi:TolB-like protein